MDLTDHKDENLWLMKGDCLERMKEIPDGSVDMILCDLPYGTTACKWDSVIPFEPLWREYRRVTTPNAAFVLTASQPFTTSLIASNRDALKYELIWEKSKATGHALCNVRPMKAHENVLVFCHGRECFNPQKTAGKPYKQRLGTSESVEFATGTKRNDNETGERFPRSVLYFKTAESEGRSVHPTQKPVALMKYLIRTYTNEGETVLDNTMGSGTTGVACVNAGRKFIGIEMDDTYFDIAKTRVLESEMQRSTPKLLETFFEG
jgi:DNA modification methylase